MKRSRDCFLRRDLGEVVFVFYGNITKTRKGNIFIALLLFLDYNLFIKDSGNEGNYIAAGNGCCEVDLAPLAVNLDEELSIRVSELLK